MGMPGSQKINRYDVAFKRKAVQMSNQPGVLIKDVAESEPPRDSWRLFGLSQAATEAA
ncbi:hypothetical protein [Methylibium sp.]|uniref:hypothetical protein n=1 Tax=Methylibium sp. TaxID=2067992 RepID=UPI003BAD07A6